MTFSSKASIANQRLKKKYVLSIIFIGLHLVSGNKQSMSFSPSVGATALIGSGLIICGWSAASAEDRDGVTVS